MNENVRAGFGVAYGAVSFPAGAAVTHAHAISHDFAAWFQRQLWHWNFEDGSPMTLMGGKMGAIANSESLLLEYSCLDDDLAGASSWVRQSFEKRRPPEGVPAMRPVTVSRAWRALLASVAPGSHFDVIGDEPATGIPSARALELLRERYGLASAVVCDAGVDIVRPRLPWRPACASSPAKDSASKPIPGDVRRTYLAVSLPGLSQDSGRQALAFFSSLNYGGLVTMLSRSGVPTPGKSRFQLMTYWGRSFVVGDLHWAPGDFGRAEKDVRRILSHPRELAWLAARAAPYCLRRTLDDSRERARATATRLLYGSELPEDLLVDTDWREVLEVAEEPAAAMVA
jgi:hypothetical protein